jgi:hypothetical protein
MQNCQYISRCAATYRRGGAFKIPAGSCVPFLEHIFKLKTPKTYINSYSMDYMMDIFEISKMSLISECFEWWYPVVESSPSPCAVYWVRFPIDAINYSITAILHLFPINFGGCLHINLLLTLMCKIFIYHSEERVRWTPWSVIPYV